MRFKFILLSSVLFVAATLASAQADAKTESRAAFKFAEIGTANSTVVFASLRKYREELNKDPTAQGYVINYGTPRAIRIRRTLILRSDLLRYCDFDCPRVTFVDGATKTG